MTTNEANKRYSTLEGAIEYLSLLSKEFEKNETEIGTSQWLFETVIHTALFNLHILEIYKNKYGELSVNDLKLLKENKVNTNEDR